MELVSLVGVVESKMVERSLSAQKVVVVGVKVVQVEIVWVLRVLQCKGSIYQWCPQR